MPRIPLLPVAVDDFTWAPGVSLFLLSHLHTDHLVGLSPSWDGGRILATPVTRDLLLQRMPQLAPRVTPVAVGEMYREELSPGVSIEITPAEASHCIGACMFLLRGYFGTVLCTGDFRFDPAALARTPQLQGGVVDDLFLDDTFLDPRHDFPAPGTALAQAVDWLEEAEHRLGQIDRLLVRVDTWGKEDLLVTLARYLRTLIVVDDDRMALVRVAQRHGALPDLFTTERSLGRVWAVPFKPREDGLRFMSSSEGLQVVGLIPSGWCGTRPQAGHRLARVGYSAHSSYSEILRFVEWLRPRACHSTSRRDHGEAVRLHLGHLLRTPGQPQTILERLDWGKMVPKAVVASLSVALRNSGAARGGGRARGAVLVPLRRRPKGARLQGCAAPSQPPLLPSPPADPSTHPAAAGYGGYGSDAGSSGSDLFAPGEPAAAADAADSGEDGELSFNDVVELLCTPQRAEPGLSRRPEPLSPRGCDRDSDPTEADPEDAPAAAEEASPAAAGPGHSSGHSPAAAARLDMPSPITPSPVAPGGGSGGGDLPVVPPLQALDGGSEPRPSPVAPRTPLPAPLPSDLRGPTGAPRAQERRESSASAAGAEVVWRPPTPPAKRRRRGQHAAPLRAARAAKGLSPRAGARRARALPLAKRLPRPAPPAPDNE
eukprot:TRINITY_DN6629_c0_g2_i1.p1 TRINITY_DN6629_c0_g2~~TRINITY_DN6629_c0_g2_i1.p1  ORF type:complete len:657 (+),score=179.63 TRINITY_DN6629_c0_g2_i1:86-2056(+)